MAERSSYGHGEFNWVDVMTRDTDSAKVFYSGLFGLSFVDERHDDGSVYTLGVKGTGLVVGLMRQPDELCEMGIPPFWETYVKVDDVEATAARVAECGGTLLGPVVDVPGGAGRIAVVQDPTGAVVILWEPIEHFGAHLVNEHGTMCWHELVTGDVDAAMAFYSDLLGWTPVPTGMGELVAIQQGDEFIASASPAPEGVSAHWAVYFAVDDCDAAVEHCARLGGRTVVPAMDQPPGRMAALADDQGAMFWVITLNPDFSMSPG